MSECLARKFILGAPLCIAGNRLVIAGMPVLNLPKGSGLSYAPQKIKIDNKPQFLAKIRAMFVICGYNMGL